MSILASKVSSDVMDVQVLDAELIVHLSDGRTVSAPLACWLHPDGAGPGHGRNGTFCRFFAACPMKAFLAGSNITD